MMRRRIIALAALRVGLMYAVLASSSAAAQDRCALLVASGRFRPGVRHSALDAVSSDCRLMASLLQWRFGFAPGSIRVIGLPRTQVPAGCQAGPERATRRAIVEGLAWLRSMARARSYAVLYYTGHGTQVLDRDGDEGVLDQALVTYEGGVVLDDEIAAWTRTVRCRQLTLVYDCCYSAGLERGPATAGFLPKGVPGIRIPASLRARQRAMRRASPRGEILAACGRDEEALALLPGPRSPVAVSAFTWALCRALTWSAGAVACREALELARCDIRRLPTAQNPRLSGRHPDGPFAAPPPARGGHAIPARLDGALCRVPIGELAGVRKGWVFAQTSSQRSARTLEAVEVSPFEARLRPLGGIAGACGVVPCRPTAPSVDARALVVASKGVAPRSPLPPGVVVVDSDGIPADLVIGADSTQAGIWDAAWGIPVSRAEGVSGSFDGMTACLRYRRALLSLLEWENPVHPLGLRLTSDRGLAPLYDAAARSPLRLSVLAAGAHDVLIVLAEPDGSLQVWWASASAADPLPSRLSLPALWTYAPACDTQVFALASPRPLQAPLGRLPSRGAGRWRSVDVAGAAESASLLEWIIDTCADTHQAIDLARMTVRVGTPR